MRLGEEILLGTFLIWLVLIAATVLLEKVLS